MATIKLTRQEIWTILCWVGDPGSDGMLAGYNIEEASVIQKLQSALAEEDDRLKAKAEAAQKKTRKS